jgi:FemAB-related protein (PEP-CTERM system-associated)
MDVYEVSSRQKSAWDSFVNHFPGSSPFQLSGWVQVFESAFGLNTYLLSARESGEMKGVLPLMYVRAPLWGNYLTSMPGGLITEDPEAAQCLLAYAKQLVKQLGARYLVLRDAYRKHDDPDLITSEAHCSMQIDLRSGRKHVRKNMNATTRKMINRTNKDDLKAVFDNEQFERFYQVYLTAMRQRGTPTQGVDFFRTALEAFPDRFQLITVLTEDRILGGGFVFLFNDWLICTWAGLDTRFYDLNTSYALYWHAILYGIRQGRNNIDLGRSAVESGTYQHKLGWGAQPKQMYQQFYLNKIDAPPKVGGNRNGSLLYKTFVDVWRLFPLPVTEFVGPRLRRRVPFG